MRKTRKEPVCAITASLDVLGGKWKVFILSQLAQGTRRFGELKKAIPAVTQKMLTQHLRELEEAGLIARAIYPEVPPRVEYRLTPHGLTLRPVLQALNSWGREHLRFLGQEQEEEQSGGVGGAMPWRVGEAPEPAPAPTDRIAEAALTDALRAALV